MDPTQPHLVNDVLELIIALAPCAFVRVDKWCHKRVLSGFETGKYALPALNYVGMCSAAHGASDEIFRRLLGLTTMVEVESRILIRYTIDNALYAKTKIISASFCRWWRIHATPVYVDKYYQLYGVDGIVVEDSGTVIADNFNMIIPAAYLLPVIPLQFVDALYDQHGDAIRKCWDLHERTLFKNSTHERLYEIFRHHQLIHYKLVRRMLSNGAMWIEKLLDAGVKISSAPMPDELVRAYTLMTSQNAISTNRVMDTNSNAFKTLREHLIANSMDENGWLNCTVVADMCAKLDIYMGAINDDKREVAAAKFAEWVDARYTGETKLLIKLCITKGYDILATHLLRSKTVVGWCNDTVSHAINRVAQLTVPIAELLRSTRVDITTVENRPIYKIIVLLLCYIDRFDRHLLWVITMDIYKLHPATKAAIGDIQQFISHIQTPQFNPHGGYTEIIDTATRKFIIDYGHVARHPYYQTPSGYL